MYKNLVYDAKEYKDFLINEKGEIKNKKTNHIYKMSISKSGYYCVTLPMGKKGKVKGIRIHKAIAETFIPNPNGYDVVHHRDENKLNFTIDNLEWCTKKDNVNYHLQKMSKETEYYNNRKLNRYDVLIIRFFSNSLSNRQLANAFNVSKTTIRNVRNGYCYKNC